MHEQKQHMRLHTKIPFEARHNHARCVPSHLLGEIIPTYTSTLHLPKPHIAGLYPAILPVSNSLCTVPQPRSPTPSILQGQPRPPVTSPTTFLVRDDSISMGNTVALPLPRPYCRRSRCTPSNEMPPLIARSWYATACRHPCGGACGSDVRVSSKSWRA